MDDVVPSTKLNESCVDNSHNKGCPAWSKDCELVLVNSDAVCGEKVGEAASDFDCVYAWRDESFATCFGCGKESVVFVVDEIRRGPHGRRAFDDQGDEDRAESLGDRHFVLFDLRLYFAHLFAHFAFEDSVESCGHFAQFARLLRGQDKHIGPCPSLNLSFGPSFECTFALFGGSGLLGMSWYPQEQTHRRDDALCPPYQANRCERATWTGVAVFHVDLSPINWLFFDHATCASGFLKLGVRTFDDKSYHLAEDTCPLDLSKDDLEILKGCGVVDDRSKRSFSSSDIFHDGAYVIARFGQVGEQRCALFLVQEFVQEGVFWTNSTR